MIATSLYIVYHVAGIPSRIVQHDPVTHERVYEQRCTRCDAVLNRHASSLPLYQPGEEIERGEYKDEQGVTHVKYSAVPLYDLNARYRELGQQVPRCR